MSMALGKVFEPFGQQRPICGMARGVLAHRCNAERIDALVARTAKVQSPRAVLFASVGELMGQVVLGIQPSGQAAYQAQADQLGVSEQARYDQLHHVAWCVSAALVRDAARQAAPVMGARHTALPPLGPGYRTNMLDGHHLAASAHRLAERRRTWAAPLPGPILGVLDQQPMRATEVVWCEDGHAQERSLRSQVRPWVTQDDVWMADRHFCTGDVLGGLAARGGCCVMRQPGPLQGTVVGSRPYQGAIDTGTVYAPRIDRVNAQGERMTRRRLPVAWREPPREGDAAIPLLRNVPRRHASAQTLAASDGKRWTIATMGQEWTDTLTCAGQALGYPQAAVFGFCLALLAYNAVAVLKAALRAVHGGAQVQQAISMYDLAWEIAQTDDGMMVAIPSPYWMLFRTMHAKQRADVFTELAPYVNLRRYQKHPRGLKKERTQRTAYTNGSHVSTAKILAKRI
jgi:hypothetical protein